MNNFFREFLLAIFNFDKENKFNEQFQFYIYINQILESYDNIDFSGLIEFNLFAIFLRFIQGVDSNQMQAFSIIIETCINFHHHCQEAFAEDFVASPLCSFFAHNLNSLVLKLFSVIVIHSEKINATLTNFDILDKILLLTREKTDYDTLTYKYCFLANYCNSCDITDLSNLIQVVRYLIDKIDEETDETHFNNRLIGISRAIQKSAEICKYLMATDFFKFLNYIFSNGDENKIYHCLIVYERILNDINLVEDRIKEEIHLNTFIQLCNRDSEVGEKAISCLINLLNDQVYEIEDYINNGFIQIAENIFNEGSYKMKKNLIKCINNVLIVYNIGLTQFLNENCINMLISSIIDLKILDDTSIADCIENIFLFLIKENKTSRFEEITFFINNELFEETEEEKIQIYQKFLYLMQEYVCKNNE
ncbi:hypothetical protein TRFO_21023 [Tritrichomonas foetus]|uniref:Uncharacterized protein n=1 Tax=Tritrichomonas foetus TaxID=1144522 RepID=A0A1J4KES6_9EUKA|nr:hypothetical protein TRFO_21023 [Tritrichomonas foetus]|eukprot:OHT09935.1 hypothetical protein TRFO_21023 [Tritrichomonas foetus]